MVRLRQRALNDLLCLGAHGVRVAGGDAGVHRDDHLPREQRVLLPCRHATPRRSAAAHAQHDGSRGTRTVAHEAASAVQRDRDDWHILLGGDGEGPLLELRHFAAGAAGALQVQSAACQHEGRDWVGFGT